MTQRVIKFRAMRDDMNPSWVYGSLLYGGDIPRIQELPLFSLFTTCLKGTEGQFTGLQDKNGKDIYEGDIVRCSIFEREQFDEHYSGIAVEVKWMDKSGGFYPFVIASGWRSSVEDVELLGNIYENPELLK